MHCLRSLAELSSACDGSRVDSSGWQYRSIQICGTDEAMRRFEPRLMLACIDEPDTLCGLRQRGVVMGESETNP